MKIAHISLPWNALPPKNYGGTEVMLYQLIIEQVKQGHDVTLLAPADSQTPARLISFLPRSLREEGVPWDMHVENLQQMIEAIPMVAQLDRAAVYTHVQEHFSTQVMAKNYTRIYEQVIASKNARMEKNGC